MVGLLLGQGGEINVQDKKQWCPLHYAAKYGFLEVVKVRMLMNSKIYFSFNLFCAIVTGRIRCRSMCSI